ncbi:hypothetical protein D3C78_1642310 [compost metagenome]
MADLIRTKEAAFLIKAAWGRVPVEKAAWNFSSYEPSGTHWISIWELVFSSINFSSLSEGTSVV